MSTTSAPSASACPRCGADVVPGALRDLCLAGHVVAEHNDAIAAEEAAQQQRRAHSTDDDTGDVKTDDAPGGGSAKPRPDAAWPEPPGEAAFAGIAGRFVAIAAPHTESDHTALLANLLIAFSSAIGTNAHALVGATRHHARENAILAGRSAKARKGDSWSPVQAVYRSADAGWLNANVVSGLSSGEGLIHAVRDAVTKSEPIKDRGRIVGYQDVEIDPGVIDKRLLVIEPEFARVLRVMTRDGSTLSAIIRSAWDSGDLRVMTRSTPIAATAAHIEIIGHITVEELRRELADTEAVNGFANRFLWFAVKRSKLLPEPEPLDGSDVDDLADELARLIIFASRVGEMQRDANARELWCDIYRDLSVERDGLAGAITARGEAHVLRLSMIYALLDNSDTVKVEHLQSALELWAYSERSVEYIFADATGNPIADSILQALRRNSEMTRTQISDLFARHASAARIAQALELLITTGKAQTFTRETAGRPSEIWKAR